MRLAIIIMFHIIHDASAIGRPNFGQQDHRILLALSLVAFDLVIYAHRLYSLRLLVQEIKEI